MEWLKDKKNLPIVIGLAVFVLLGSGGLIAFELGLFPSGAPTPVAPQVAGRGGPTPSGSQDDRPDSPSPMPNAMPSPLTPASRPPAAAGAKTAAAPAKPVVVDPAQGPNPFNIPGGQKKMAALLAGNSAKTPLRDLLPTLNLFKPIVAAPVALPTPLTTPGQPGGLQTQSARKIVSGIINGADGISAILEVNGESQTVKPGDSLLDGSKVISIQPTSVTIREADGATTAIPLTSGSGGGDQGQNGQDPNGGQPQPQPFGQ